MIGFDKDLQKIKTPIHLKHFYTLVDKRKKVSFFLQLLKLLEEEKTIIFVSTADQANYLNELCLNFMPPKDNYDLNSQNRLFKQKFFKIHGFLD